MTSIFSIPLSLFSTVVKSIAITSNGRSARNVPISGFACAASFNPHRLHDLQWSYDSAFPRRSMSTSSRWRKESLLRLYSLGPKARLERRPPHSRGFSVVRTPTSSGLRTPTNQPHLKCGSCIATSHKQEKCNGLRRVSHVT